MSTLLLFLELAVVVAMIYLGAKVGSIGLGMYGMVGVFILVFVFGLEPGVIPIDVMLIIVAVITASAALQEAGGLDYMVDVAARFLRKHRGGTCGANPWPPSAVLEGGAQSRRIAPAHGRDEERSDEGLRTRASRCMRRTTTSRAIPLFCDVTE